MATAALDLLDHDAGALGIRIQPLNPVIGAEIHGLDLTRPLTDAQFDVLRAAWLRHKVVFLRNQPLSPAQHVELARRFGPLEGHPVIPHAPGYPELLIISGTEGVKPTPETIEGFKGFNKWHTDVTFRQQPSVGSVLRARQVPAYGGDTIWADAAAAWRGLPQAVKDRLEGLEAEHDILRSFGPRVTEEKRAEIAALNPPVRHPVVRRHPETGERALYVNYTFTTRIIGLEPDDSEALLRLLFDRIKVPEYHVRWNWTPDSIAIWDNRATQHDAVGDYWPAPRTMERVTIAGDDVFA